MKEAVYKCLDEKCGYKFRGMQSHVDGTSCPKCKGHIIRLLRKATCNDRNIPQMSRKIPILEVKPPRNNITVTLTLEDSEKFIEQLKAIEDHLDRIIEKQKLLKGPEVINCTVNTSLENCTVDEVVKGITNSLANIGGNYGR